MGIWVKLSFAVVKNMQSVFYSFTLHNKIYAYTTLHMKIGSWKSQLRKGAAELALLSLLSEEALSGTGLLDRMAEYSEIGLSDGTIYPLLKRLEREGRITGKWRLPEGNGRPTKHYSLTNDGKAALGQMQHAWSDFRDELTNLLGDA